MPIKWTDQAHLTLLLKLLEQNPITKYDAEAISSSWPGPEKPTPRAIYEQILVLRKRASTHSQGNSVGKATGKINFKPSKVASASFPTAKKSIGSSGMKKRKFRESEDESEELESTHTGMDTDSEQVDCTTFTPAKSRNQPARKNRSRNYVLDGSDSEGLVDAAAKTISDGDDDFVLEGIGKTHQSTCGKTGHGNAWVSRHAGQTRGSGMDGTDEEYKLFIGSCEHVGDADEDKANECEEDDEDDGTRSFTTMVTRRTSWATACEQPDIEY